MVFEDFELLVTNVKGTDKGKNDLITFRVNVVRSPAGETIDGSDSYYKGNEMRKCLRKLRTKNWGEAIQLGGWLSTLLFPSNVNDLLLRSIDLVKTNKKGLRIRLLLSGPLCNIPWEYVLLNRGGGEVVLTDFLGLQPDISIVRHQAATLPPWRIEVNQSARLLVASANPNGYPSLKTKKEQQVIRQSLKGNKIIETIFVNNATMETLSKYLEKVHLFHFSGHGKFQVEIADDWGAINGTGAIILEDRHKEAVPINAGPLALKLRRAGVRVAILASCKSGQRDDFNIWSSVAVALLKAEVGAVVGMQNNVSDKSAFAFNDVFYRSLSSGLSIDEAVTNGRIEISQIDSCAWGVPVLYLRSPDGIIFPEFAQNSVLEEARKEESLKRNKIIKISQNKPLGLYKGDHFSSFGLDAPGINETIVDVNLSSLLIKRKIQQELISDIFRFGKKVRWFAVIGESGTGKSCLLNLLAKETTGQWFIRAHSLLGLEGPQSATRLKAHKHFLKNAGVFLNEFEKKMPNYSTNDKVYVLIDTLDLIINEIGENSVREFLQSLLLYPNTMLITTCRPREFKVLAKPFKKYKKQNDRITQNNDEYNAYYHLVRIDDFNDDELLLVLDRYIDAFYKGWGIEQKKALSERLQTLRNEKRNVNHICRHPLSLRILFEVYAGELIPEDINLQELYILFWRKKVRGIDPQTAPLRECYVMQAALWMFELGSDQINEESVARFFFKKNKSQYISRVRDLLRSENIFRHRADMESKDWLGAGSKTNQLEFFHQSFLEYSAAKALLSSECDFISILMKYAQKVPSDSMRLEVLRQLAYQDEYSARKVLPILLESESIFLKKIAIDIYLKLDASSAGYFRTHIEKFLTKSIHIHKTNPNVLLLHLLDNIHNIPDHRYNELFHLETGFLTYLILNTAYSQIIEHLFNAVGRIMLFPNPLASDWLKKCIHEWELPVKENRVIFPRCTIAPILNWLKWDEDGCMPTLWYIFTCLSRDKIKLLILNQWPQLSPTLRHYYREAFLQYLEKYPEDLKGNMSLTEAIADTFKKLFCEKDERGALLGRMEQIIIRGKNKYAQSIASELMARLLPANQRQLWGEKILMTRVLPSKSRMFLLDNFLKLWLEEGDETIKKMLWEALKKGDESSELYSGLLNIWGNYMGDLSTVRLPYSLYRFATRKKNVPAPLKQYALKIIAKTLTEDAHDKLKEFFDLVEELPRKTWSGLFRSIPAHKKFQPIILEKIQSYAARKEGFIKQAALWLIMDRSWNDDSCFREILQAFKKITNTTTDMVLELTLKEILNTQSLLDRLDPLFLHYLGWRCFNSVQYSLRIKGLRLIIGCFASNRLSLQIHEWQQIWQAIESQPNPQISLHLWELIKIGIATRDPNFSQTWSWNIVGSFLDKWIEDDYMQRAVQEAFIVVGEWGTNAPSTATDFLLRYLDRRMRRNGEYKWVGAMLRIIISKSVTQEPRQEIISKILDLWKKSGPEKQVILTGVIVRIPEKLLKLNKNWEGFDCLLADSSICDRTKVILNDHVGRFLEIPPLPTSFFQNIRKNVCS